MLLVWMGLRGHTLWLAGPAEAVRKSVLLEKPGQLGLEGPWRGMGAGLWWILTCDSGKHMRRGERKKEDEGRRRAPF